MPSGCRTDRETIGVKEFDFNRSLSPIGEYSEDPRRRCPLNATMRTRPTTSFHLSSIAHTQLDSSHAYHEGVLDPASSLDEQAPAERDRALRPLDLGYARKCPDQVAQLENDAEARRREAMRVEIARGELVKRRERLGKPMREVRSIDYASAFTRSSFSPSAVAMASMLLSFVSRPYSILRTVAGFGIPAALATAYQVSPFRSRAARIFAPIPRVTGRGRFGLGGKSC